MGGFAFAEGMHLMCPKCPFLRLICNHVSVLLTLLALVPLRPKGVSPMVWVSRYGQGAGRSFTAVSMTGGPALQPNVRADVGPRLKNKKATLDGWPCLSRRFALGVSQVSQALLIPLVF